jgi:hypothetical protein
LRKDHNLDNNGVSKNANNASNEAKIVDGRFHPNKSILNVLAIPMTNEPFT